jgi:membrane protein DedA with SNARE-associated domain
MSALFDRLLALHGLTVYAIVAALVFAEDALFVGFVIPGETAAILAGVAASRGNVSLVTTIIVVVLAAIVGDNVGYEVGRRFGTRLLDTRLLARRRKRIDDAREMLSRRGGIAVFLGRFVAFFRAVMPALAGTARMPYRTFLLYNAAGGIVWGAGSVLVGYLAGNSYPTVERLVGRTTAIVAAVVVVALVIGWRIRRHRREGG